MKKLLSVSFLLVLVNFQLLKAQSTWDWAHVVSGTSTVWSTGLSTDKSGNSYSIGYFYSDATLDSTIAIPGTGQHILLIKTDADGNVEWTKSFPFTFGATETHSVAAKESGGCYITGSFGDSIVFDNYRLYGGLSNTYFTSIDIDGNIMWAFSGTGYAEGQGVTCTGGDQAIFSGNYTDSVSINSEMFINEPFYPGSYIIKMDSSGNTLWSDNITGNASVSGRGITSDINGNIYLDCEVSNSAVFNGQDTITAMYCHALAKYDSTGDLAWVKNIVDGDVAEVSLTVNSDGTIFCAGEYSSPSDFQTISLPISVYGNGDYDGFMASYDTAGTVRWANHMYAGGGTHIWNINAGVNGLIYFVGSFRDDSLIISNSGIVLTDDSTNTPGGNIAGVGFFGTINDDGDILALNTSVIERNALGMDSLDNLYISGVSFDTITDIGNFHFNSGGIVIARHSDIYLSVNSVPSEYTTNVFPNPSTGSFSIATEDLVTQITIYNINGQKVYTKQISSGEKVIHCNVDLKAGLYFLETSSKNSSKVRKIVVY